MSPRASCLLIRPSVRSRDFSSDTAMGKSDSVLEVGKFSDAQEHGSFPSGWKPLTFSRIEEHTQYFLVTMDGTVVVKAVSENGRPQG